jgi:AAA family ATP:ADP antiporter
MLRHILAPLWGKLSQEELKKFSLLALGFFFLIGSFWPLKTLKDSVFINTVGATHLPIAKLYSLFFFFPLVMLYSYLVDVFTKEQLIYSFATIAASVGFVFSYFFSHPIIGLHNTIPSKDRILGWAFYFFIESYISLMLSLYWSFVNDITPPESAKKGYGLIIFGTQFGGLVFISIANALSRNPDLYAQRAPLIAAACFAMFFGVAAVVYFLMKLVSKNELSGYHGRHSTTEKLPDHKRIKFIEGLRLLLTRPYVMGIFMLVWLQEVIGTVMNYQIYIQLEAHHQHAGMRNAFLFDFSLMIQLVACLFGLLGTSFFQRRFGIKACLVAYPLLFAGCIALYFMRSSLFVIAAVLVVSKALNYAFQQPTKEILYTPTSHDTKYKAKAWIDMFGLRFGKMTGSFFNKLIGANGPLVGGLAFVIIGGWTLIAHTIGTTFQDMTAQNKMID